VKGAPIYWLQFNLIAFTLKLRSYFIRYELKFILTESQIVEVDVLREPGVAMYKTEACSSEKTEAVRVLRLVENDLQNFALKILAKNIFPEGSLAFRIIGDEFFNIKHVRLCLGRYALVSPALCSGTS
jgi:hypothetical protein